MHFQQTLVVHQKEPFQHPIQPSISAAQVDGACEWDATTSDGSAWVAGDRKSLLPCALLGSGARGDDLADDSVYNSSVLTGRQWIDHCYVAITFINSFSTPLVQHFARKPAQERVLCLVADVVLDLTMAVILPLTIVAPYYQAFDHSIFSFDLKLLYNVSWFINLIMDNRQVFVRDGLDLALKIVPHVLIFSSVGSIQSLICEKQAVVAHSPQGKTRLDGPTALNLRPARRSSAATSRDHVAQEELAKKKRHGIYSFIHVVFIILGCMIVLFHLLAVTAPPRDNNVFGCKMHLYPWFMSKFACSVYEYNCYRHGTTSPSEDSLAFLDEKSLAGLVLSHCPELIVPKAIQRFKNLLGFEIWDSSIASWSKEAGLTQQTHPLITYVCLVVVNMSALPDGLLYDLPRELQDIEITRTNLNGVPDDLDAKWRFVRSLYLEYAQLTSVPPSLTAMNIKDFSVVGNQIPNLTYPAPGSNGNGYIVLPLSKNPIQELPDNIGNLSDLLFLALENTNLRQLSPWVSALQNKQGSKAFLHGTPFCNSKSPEGIDAHFGASAVVTCLDNNPRKFGRYPYEVVRSLQLP